MPQEQPSSSAYQCPGHGRRVKGAFGVACDRFATLDPATAPQDSAPRRNWPQDWQQRASDEGPGKLTQSARRSRLPRAFREESRGCPAPAYTVEQIAFGGVRPWDENSTSTD